MEEQQQTLLEQTQAIRMRYQRGEITPVEAKQQIKPFYDTYVKTAKEKAKQHGMRAPIMSLEKFLSRRSDLRDVIQREVVERHESRESGEEA